MKNVAKLAITNG